MIWSRLMTVASCIDSSWGARRYGKLRLVRYYFDLTTNLVARDIKFRYKGSFLGLFWSLLNPMALIAIYSFLFTRVLPLDIPDYVPFLAAGVLPWNCFAASLDFSADALLANRDLIKKAVFPNEMLLVASITSNLLILALGIPVLLVFLIASGIPFTPAMLLLPAIIALQLTFTLGLALIVSTLNVYLRDTRHLLGVALFAWFFLTPVFYDHKAVPAAYQSLYSANPMARLIDGYRDVLLFGRVPDGTLMGQLALASAVVLVCGLAVFGRYKSSFPEEL